MSRRVDWILSHQKDVEEAGYKPECSGCSPACIYPGTEGCHTAGGHQVEEGPDDANDETDEADEDI